MASLLARLGPPEAQRATVFVRHYDKKWGIGQVCRERRPRSQKRPYSASIDLHPSFGADPSLAEREHPMQRLAEFNSAWKRSPPVAAARPEHNSPAEQRLTSPPREGELSSEERRGLESLLDSIDEGARDESEHFGETAFSWSMDGIPHWSWTIPQKVFENCKNVRYRARFQTALDRGRDRLAVNCWLAAERNQDGDFFRSITDESFEQMLDVVTPRAMRLTKLEDVHKGLPPKIVRNLQLRPMHHISGEYANVLHHIWSTRRKYHTLTVEQYAIFLRMARELGHKIFAETLFQALHEDGLTPDVECWNEYIGAVIYNRTHRAWTRHQVRTTAYHMERRLHAKGLFKNYAVGPGGIKESVTKLFQKMLREGISPNERTFRFFIVAAAREGDVETVKSVLKKIWGVDVDELRVGVSEEEVVTKEMTRQSILYPSPDLLTALAHAFTINNEFSTALQTVDFMSRRFKVSVLRETWEELFERVLPLVRGRSGSKSRIDGSKKGVMDPKIVRRLFDTATGHPYYIEPTMRMYDILFRSFTNNHADGAFGRTASEPYMIGMEYVLVKGVFAYRKSLRRFHELRHMLKGAKSHRHGDYDDILESYEQALLQSKRDHWCLRYWIRRLLAVTPDMLRARNMKAESFYFRRLPQLLLLCEPWAPSKVWYEIPGGRVEFDLRTNEEILKSHRASARHAWEQKKRGMRATRVVGRNWLFAPNMNPETKRLKRAGFPEIAPLPYDEFQVGRPPRHEGEFQGRSAPRDADSSDI